MTNIWLGIYEKKVLPEIGNCTLDNFNVWNTLSSIKACILSDHKFYHFSRQFKRNIYIYSLAVCLFKFPCTLTEKFQAQRSYLLYFFCVVSLLFVSFPPDV